MLSRFGIVKEKWPYKYRDFTLGGRGYLFASFDNGFTYYELDTAKDVTWTVDWDSVDVTTRANGVEKVNWNTRRSFNVSTDLLFDTSATNQSVCKKILLSSVKGDYYLVGSFSENGAGPLMWTYSTIDVNEELNGITKLSVKFNPVHFVCFFNDFTSQYHPYNLVYVQESKPPFKPVIASSVAQNNDPSHPTPK